MKLKRILGGAIVVLALSVSALAQQAMQPQPDQVDRLAEMVGLSEEQQAEIRQILEEAQGQIAILREKALLLQQQMQSQVRADFDEASIRESARALGELTGEIAALSTLMQAKVDRVFTPEQREELNRHMRQMQQQIQRPQEDG